MIVPLLVAGIHEPYSRRFRTVRCFRLCGTDIESEARYESVCTGCISLDSRSVNFKYYTPTISDGAPITEAGKA